MALSDAQLATLKAELNTDPQSLGLTAMDNPTATDKLNELNPSFTIPAGRINGQELQMAVDGTEFIALTPEKRDGWLALISAGDGQVDVNHAAVTAQATAIWGASTTLTNLAALQNRTASRAEVLFGINIAVIDVVEARRL